MLKIVDLVFFSSILFAWFIKSPTKNFYLRFIESYA